jgi:hypothetical protein
MAVLKSPWGTSGRRNMRLLPHEPSEKQRTWMKRVIDGQGALVIEPHFDRVLDLSYQFRVELDGGLTGLGLTRTMTDESGRFRGVFVGRALEGLEAQTRDFFFRGGEESDWIERALHAVAERCAVACAELGYQGPAGIDAMIVRDGQRLLLRPLVELNVRRTMGQFGLELSRRIAPGATGAWIFIGAREREQANASSFEEIMSGLEAALPMDHVAKPKTQLRQGAIATNEPSTAEQVLSVLLVSRQLAAIREALGSIGLSDLYTL